MIDNLSDDIDLIIVETKNQGNYKIYANDFLLNCKTVKDNLGVSLELWELCV